MLLPDPRRRGEIRFKVARALPYGMRLALIAVLLAAGFALQAVAHPAVGAALLLAATLLSLVSGYTNVPPDDRGKREWRGADRRELEQVIAISRKAKSWDRSLLDITCGPGAATLVAGAAAVLIASAWLRSRGLDRLADVWVIDCAVLLLPHWFTGVRRVLTNAPLVVKLENLLAVFDDWERDRREGETMAPQIEILVGKAGEMPRDAKLIFRPAGASADFLGLQVQVTLNNVQGSDYPYLYAVLVARPAYGLLRRRLPPPLGPLVVEPKSENGVDIIVIRQRTTKTSGYHTPPRVCRTIFAFALAAARQAAQPA